MRRSGRFSGHGHPVVLRRVFCARIETGQDQSTGSHSDSSDRKSRVLSGDGVLIAGSELLILATFTPVIIV